MRKVLFCCSLLVLLLSSVVEAQQLDMNKTESREELESAFLEGLMNHVFLGNRMEPEINPDELVGIGDNLYMLPGDSYLMKSVNRNAYLMANMDGSFDFVVDPKQPMATIANMIVLGVGYPAMLGMTVIRHEYGEKTILEVPLEHFLQYCILCGCRLYWGFESFEDDLLKGTLFCYQAEKGYEHVVRLSCHPSGLGDEDFTMEARVSLFVPTKNVNNVFMDYE